MIRAPFTRPLTAALLVGLAAIAVFVILVPPQGQAYWPKCILNATTGLHCPGCGATRSFHLLSHGDLVGAVSQNALFVFVGLPLMAWFYFAGARFVATGKYVSPQITGKRTSAILAVIVISFMALRNVPVEPFSSLAPRELAAHAQRE